MKIDELPPIQAKRKIVGMSAVLLPFDSAQHIDWPAFRSLLEKTCAAGLIPAVNMDTGYANLIDHSTRQLVLDETRAVLAGEPFVAGAYVDDVQSRKFQLENYLVQINQIGSAGGTPIIFQSSGLTAGSDAEILNRYLELAKNVDQFYAFELGQMFAPFGKIYSLNMFHQLLAIPQCIGSKHSSLDRIQEWRRLQIRDRHRPDFQLLTGNDLAIDMVIYGSDYLLGLSTFAPDLFAKRDQYWLDGDARFFELNDTLQYLGNFAFRDPTPAYKHSAAMFLELRGWIKSSTTHPDAMNRPVSDRPILSNIGKRLGLEMEKN